MTSTSRPDTGDPGRRVLELLRHANSPVCLGARGFCMEPLVRDGDVVEVVPVIPVATPGPGQIEVGQVVLAGQAADELVCHRVLARDGDRYILAGDRSLVLESIDRSAIHGVVRVIEREGRTLDLKDGASRLLDSCLLSLHLWCAGRRGTLVGRVVNRLRRGLLRVRGQRWRNAENRRENR